MDVYQAIKNRRTVRDFQPKKIDRETLGRILDAGLKAPSNNHLREWEFVIVDDLDTRIKLIEKVRSEITDNEISDFLASFNATDEYQRMMYFDAVPKQYRMLLEAGTLILPLFKQDYPLLKPKSLSDLNGFASIWLCIENILLAAVSEGIQGVTRIPFDEEIKHINTILNIPDNYYVPCYIALGYPDENAKPVRQIPLNIEDRIHLNRW